MQLTDIDEKEHCKKTIYYVKKYKKRCQVERMHVIYPPLRHVQISGVEGAKQIAQVLRDRGVTELDFVLDEGFFILDGFLDGIHQPVAM